jgi:hypothetical protein
MPFEFSESESPPLISEDGAADSGVSRQLALRLSDEIEPANRRGRVTLRDVQFHVSYLTGQIETLRRQLLEHPADRLALLLREMIEERERELERWLMQERRWDERLSLIEGAIVERDQHRAREAALVEERDAARRAAAAAETRLEAARRATEEANRKAAAMERAAETARTEQLRLRQEREVDSKLWMKERRRLSAEAQPKGWLSRLVRG